MLGKHYVLESIVMDFVAGERDRSSSVTAERLFTMFRYHPGTAQNRQIDAILLAV
jgi:hypothetical protein